MYLTIEELADYLKLGTYEIFKPTKIQKKACELIKSGAKHIILFRGSLSSKTMVLVMAIVFSALFFAGSCHLICRYRAKDANSSALQETLLPRNNNSKTIYFSKIILLSHAAVTTIYSRLGLRVNHIANIEDMTGNPNWRRPKETRPRKLDLYPYHEVSILPQITGIGAVETYTIFMDPKWIQQGNRRGIRNKKFGATKVKGECYYTKNKGILKNEQNCLSPVAKGLQCVLSPVMIPRGIMDY